MQQALEYAGTLDIPVAISSNGYGFLIQYRKNCGCSDSAQQPCFDLPPENSASKTRSGLLQTLDKALMQEYFG